MLVDDVTDVEANAGKEFGELDVPPPIVHELAVVRYANEDQDVGTVGNARPLRMIYWNDREAARIDGLVESTDPTHTFKSVMITVCQIESHYSTKPKRSYVSVR